MVYNSDRPHSSPLATAMDATSWFTTATGPQQPAGHSNGSNSNDSNQLVYNSHLVHRPEQWEQPDGLQQRPAPQQPTGHSNGCNQLVHNSHWSTAASWPQQWQQQQ